ncbi:MAG: DUF4315 family protein [Raoultibacter sp.]
MNNPKLEKYNEERRKITEKLDGLQARAKELDGKIMEAENLEIRALMKMEKMTLSDLMALVRTMQERHRTPYSANDDAEYNPFADNGGAFPYHTKDDEEDMPNE